MMDPTKGLVSLRRVDVQDLPVFFTHQHDPEAARMAGFLSLETIRPLTARVAKHNLGSIRVLEKTGFTRVGEDAFTPTGGTCFEEFIYVLPTA